MRSLTLSFGNLKRKIFNPAHNKNKVNLNPKVSQVVVKTKKHAQFIQKNSLTFCSFNNDHYG